MTSSATTSSPALNSAAPNSAAPSSANSNPPPTASPAAPQLTFCGYGPSSTEALHAAIERCRQDQPFRTVTIVVPSLALGFAAKKDLAWSSLRSGDGGGGATPNGIFGLRLFTPSGLAEHIISICDPSAHIPNYSNRELMAALMQLGEGRFGVFEKIRSFPNTYEVLSQAVRELDRLSDAAVAQLEESAGPQLLSLLALRKAVRSHFSGADNPIQRRSSADTLAKAVELVGRESHEPAPKSEPAPEPTPARSSLWEYLGAVLVYLPQQLSTGEAELLRACHVSEIIVGLTGIAAADEMPLKSVAKIDASLVAPPASDPDPTSATPASATLASAAQPADSATSSSFRPRAAETVFMSAPTPADEVRLAIREATAAIQQGTPADQIAIAYTSASPYRRLLCETLQRSQIGFTHFLDMPLRERIAPRALLSMLALPDDGFKRIDLMNLLASAPIVAGAAGASGPTTPTGPPGDLVPSTAWDRISSEARVYQGMDNWQTQIQAFIRSRQASKSLFEATEEEDSENRIRGIEADIRQARALLDFVKSMEASVSAVRQAKTWRDKVGAAKALLDEFLPEASLASPVDVASADVVSSASTPSASTPSAPTPPSHTPSSPSPPTPIEATRDLLSDEKAAHKRLREILNSLASLDDVHPNPSSNDFRVLLDKELETASGRLGQQNVGILIADISTLLTGAFSHIWILGVAEGHLPRKIREDSLLPESTRKDTADLMSEVSRVYEQQRQFLAALQLASRRICLSYPRLDPLDTGTSLPSRWLLEVVEEMTGEQKFAQELDDFIWRRYDGQAAETETEPASAAAPTTSEPAAAPEAAAPEPTFIFIQSRTADLLSLKFPFQLQEYNLKSLISSRGIQAQMQNHELSQRNPGFARGLDAHYSRNSSEFTRFDGNLTQKFSQLADQPNAGQAPTDPAGIFAEPISPTRLERYSECPHRFFAESVLGVRPLEVPDDFEGLTPLVRGSIIHKILEDFFKEVMGIPNSDPGPASPTASPTPPPKKPLAPDHSWTTQQRQRLVEITDSCCQEAIGKSLFGPEVFHQQEIDNIKAELLLFLDHEQEHRKLRNCSPIGMEIDISRQQAFTFQLEGEAALPLRGQIDRVDFDSATGQLIAIDYKTGRHNSGFKPYRFEDLTEDNPTTHGRRLQMPMYLRAAELLYARRIARTRSRIDTPSTDIHDTAIYWFVNEASDFHRQELEFTEGTQDKIRGALTTIYQEITGGVFPPGFHSDTAKSPFCLWCNPDGFGASKHTQQLELKSGEEQLEPWITLAYPDQLPESP